jgi:hypothetical protein
MVSLASSARSLDDCNAMSSGKLLTGVDGVSGRPVRRIVLRAGGDGAGS